MSSAREEQAVGRTVEPVHVGACRNMPILEWADEQLDLYDFLLCEIEGIINQIVSFTSKHWFSEKNRHKFKIVQVCEKRNLLHLRSNFMLIWCTVEKALTFAGDLDAILFTSDPSKGFPRYLRASSCHNRFVRTFEPLLRSCCCGCFVFLCLHTHALFECSWSIGKVHAFALSDIFTLLRYRSLSSSLLNVFSKL